MDPHVDSPKPGTGRMATPDGGSQPIAVLHLDNATLALIGQSVLLGGLPGAGKSGLRNLRAMSEALADDDTTRAEG
jgi:hypothetical protein